MKSPKMAILGLAHGLACISHDAVWSRLEVIVDMIINGDMSRREMELAQELKVHMIDRVKANHHENIFQKRKGLTRIKADDKAYRLMSQHGRRLKALRQLEIESCNTTSYE